jgi:tetratricopeptide (TPR) repeat protein
MNYLFLLFFVFGVFGGVLGQDENNRILDSLKNELVKTNQDSTKWKINYEIANIQGSINLDSAILYMRKSVTLSKRLDQKKLADTHRSLAVLYARQDINLDSCSYYALLAEKFYRKKQDTAGLINCIIVLSSVERDNGRYDKCIKSIYEGIRLVDENSQSSTDSFIKLKSNLIEELLTMYFKQKNFSKMILTYKKQLKLLESIKETNIWSEYMTVYIGLGIAYLQLGQLDSAEYYALKSEKIAKSNNHYRALSYIYNNLGVIYKRKERNDIAIGYYKKAIKANSDAGANNYNTYGNLIFALVKEKKCDEALKYQEEYEKISTKLNSIEQRIDNSKIRARICHCLEKYDSAFYYIITAMDLKDSLHNINNNKTIAEIETKYQTEKKEQQIKEQELTNHITNRKLETERTKTVAVSSVAFALFLGGLVSLVLFIKNRNKNILLKKQYEKIEVQKEEIETQNQELVANNEEIQVQKEVIEKANIKLKKVNEDIKTLKISLEHDLDNDIQIIHEAGKTSIQDLLNPDKLNRFENLQSSLLAIADYYGFMNELSRSEENLDVRQLLYTMSRNILKKYNFEKIIDIKTTSNLNARNENERTAIRKTVVYIAELIRNTLKHAFPPAFLATLSEKPTIHIDLFKKENSVFIIYSDNGKGLEKDLQKSELGNGQGLSILKDSSYEEGFVWKNKEEGGIIVQLSIKVDLDKKTK